jgi:hypothetical protein
MNRMIQIAMPNRTSNGIYAPPERSVMNPSAKNFSSCYMDGFIKMPYHSGIHRKAAKEHSAMCSKQAAFCS